MANSELRSIYVIDDDGAVARTIAAALEFRDYRVRSFTQGAGALESIREDEPDLVILDIAMRDMNGLDLLRCIREVAQIPILILNIMTDSSTIVEAFDRGADAYLTKPFSIEELAARIRVLLLRTHRLGVLIYVRNFQYRGLRVDFETGTILGDGQEVTLTPKEWSVLAVLVRNAGRVVIHRQILQEAWGPQYGDETDYVRAYIARLRRKLEPDRSNPRYILSERGFGYRLPVPE